VLLTITGTPHRIGAPGSSAALKAVTIDSINGVSKVADGKK
jgi:hypothetical protein